MVKSASSKKNRNRRFHLKDFFMAAMAIVLVVAVIVLFVPKNPLVAPPPAKSEKDAEEESAISSFRKDGNLKFLDGADKTLKASIDLEIAKTIFERNRGLMYRRSLPENGGMLFIFEKMAPQSFWMKNTIISLDIIYVDDQFRIVSIAERTLPYSLEPVRSEGPAIYVVEVNGGFCNRHGVKPDDFIEYERF